MPVSGVNAGTERIDRAHKHEHESLEARIAKLEQGLNTVAGLLPGSGSGGGTPITGNVVITGQGGLEVTTPDGKTIIINIPIGTFAPPPGAGTGTGARGGDGNVPAGTVVMWSGTVATIPAGWAHYTAMDGRFPRGATTTGGTGGTDTIDININTDVSTDFAACFVKLDATGLQVNSSTHTHPVVDTGIVVTNPYREIVFMIKL